MKESSGRLLKIYILYLPSKSILSQKIIILANKPTFHEGVTMAKAQVGFMYRISTLRTKVK